MVHQENVDQRALRKWITAGLAISEVVGLHGDSGYLLNNMIAKYTLAADHYAISSAALEEFRRQEVDLSATYSRSKFYGKQNGRNPFIYEHSVPAGLIRKALLEGQRTEDDVAFALQSAGQVVVLLRAEDSLLKDAVLSARMPAGWKLGDNPLARYQAVGTTLSAQRLLVSGAICR